MKLQQWYVPCRGNILCNPIPKYSAKHHWPLLQFLNMAHYSVYSGSETILQLKLGSPTIATYTNHSDWSLNVPFSKTLYFQACKPFTFRHVNSLISWHLPKLWTSRLTSHLASRQLRGSSFLRLIQVNIIGRFIRYRSWLTLIFCTLNCIHYDQTW